MHPLQKCAMMQPRGACFAACCYCMTAGWGETEVPMDVYGALPTSIWGRMCPTRPNRLRHQGARPLDNIAYFGVGNYCASQIHHRKPQSQQATTAAGKSTIIPPFWIRPSHLNWEEQKQSTTGRSQQATATSLYLSDPHSTYTT